MPKQAKLTGIKSLRCYTIIEAATISGVSPHTIRNWSKNGLRLLDENRPALIRGDDLRAYIKGQRADRRIKTAKDEFYCVSCKQARKAAERLADCIVTGNRVKVVALCEVCGTVVSKPVAATRISELGKFFDLTITRHEATL